MADSLKEIADRLRVFREEREWQRFHTPLNLAASVAIEAGELLEVFQWATPEDLATIPSQKREALEQEIADVAINLIQLADVLGIPLAEAIDAKIKLNSEHYPIELSRGSNRKQPADG